MSGRGHRSWLPTTGRPLPTQGLCRIESTTFRGTLHLPASPAVSMPSPGLRERCTRTDTDPDDWVEIEGPLTGVGAESWHRHAAGREAYVCDDQREISVDAGALERG